MRKFIPALLAICIVLGGCAPRKEAYRVPPTPAPPAWNSGQPDSPGQGTAAAGLKWDEFFTDDKLRQVINLALDNNRNLRIAALNVEKVQAQYRIQRVQHLPMAGAAASVDAYRVPGDMTNDNRGYIAETNRAGLQVSSWELDLFGRIRALKSQALEQYLASEQARATTQMSLVASVAGSYLTLAGDRENLRLAQATLDAQKATYELIKGSRDLGIRSDLDVRQAQSQMEAAQVDVVRFTAQLTLDENALNLLVGAPVPAGLLPAAVFADQTLRDVSAGLPSDVLLRRPDIQYAEHQLRAAYANIDAARAAFFPRITLTGGGGFVSGALDELFSFRAASWTFSPQVTLPIFDYGVRKNTHKIAQLQRDTAVAEYEKAIQTAFREVSDSLSQRSRLLEQQNAEQALVQTLGETHRLADARYKAGLDNYLTVLVAQRSLYAGQQALLGLRVARLNNLITLYKVLGGGA